MKFTKDIEDRNKLEISQIITEAIAVEKEPPEPLMRPQQPPTEFPINSLPEIFKEAVLGLHDKIQAPIAICVQSLLSAANLAVQGHVNISMPFGEIKPISCFFLTIAESGERKTACDNSALRAVKGYEADLRYQCNIDLQEWEIKCASWKRQYEIIISKKNRNISRDNIESQLKELGPQPEAPPEPLIICPEPTFEGLCKLMIRSRPSLGIFSSEGGQFIGGYGMSADNKIRTAAALSEIWDGESIKRVRGGDGTIILAGKRLCMHLMVQPNIGTNFLSDIELQDQGLLSRMLISSPLSTAGTRFQREVKPESNAALHKFDRVINNILCLSLPTKEGYKNELKPNLIIMQEKTLALYKRFSDHIESEIASGKSLESIKGFANKLPEHAYRIAATFAAFDNLATRELKPRYMEMGIEIAQYYCAEVLRLFNEKKISPDIKLAARLLNWFHNKWKEEYISLPDIYQRSLNAISTKEEALKIVNLLVQHRWLEEVQGKQLIKGQVRQKVWKIICDGPYE